MALDATPAGATADSYLAVAGADAYAAADLGRFATKWASASIDEKERALKRATRDLNRAAGFVGVRFDLLQALAFPRLEDVDPVTGDPWIPASLERATYEQAAFVLYTADVIDDAAVRKARGLSNFAEPDVSGQLADDAGVVLAPRAVELLGEFTQRSIVGWIQTT